MKKKNLFISSIIIILFIFILCTIYSSDDDVIGIVLTTRGNLVLERGDTTTPLVPGNKVYRDSIIKLDQGSGRGKIQIGSNSGPVIYSRFPVKFTMTAFTPLSTAKQDHYISCIGGTVLTSRSVNLFDWFMSTLGALDEEEIKNGFSVAFSKNKNSSISLTLDPIYFKIKDDVRIKSISGKLINKDEDNKVELDSIRIEKKNNDWIIILDQYDYEYAVEYAIKTSVTHMNNKSENFEFSFYVYGDKEIDYIETEVHEMTDDGETDFGKAIIRAGRYRYYEMHVKGLRILKEAGIDIDGML